MVIKNFQIEYSNYVDITLKLIKPLTVKYFPSSYLIQFLYLLTKIAREILVHILFSLVILINFSWNNETINKGLL